MGRKGVKKRDRLCKALPVDYIFMKAKKHTAEDYLVAIMHLAQRRGTNVKCCRAKELAEILGVSRSSVSQVLRRLERAGYVYFKPYARSITLTDKGLKLAQQLHARRIVLVLLGEILGFTPERTKEIACAMEHLINDDERKKIAKLICFFNDHPDIAKKWFEYRDSQEVSWDRVAKETGSNL